MAYHRNCHPFNCFYCGRSLRNQADHPEQRTIDHVQARSKGGSRKSKNTVPACRNCNLRKGNRTVEEFRELFTFPEFWGEAKYRNSVSLKTRREIFSRKGEGTCGQM